MLAALVLACAPQSNRLTGRMPPPSLIDRCNAYAAEVAEGSKDDEGAEGARLGKEAGVQHGVDERVQQSDRARNAYADCLARYGF